MAQAGRGHKDIEMPQQYQMSQSIEEAGFRAISVVSDVLTVVDKNINFRYLFNSHSTEQDLENQGRHFPFE